METHGHGGTSFVPDYAAIRQRALAASGRSRRDPGPKVRDRAAREAELARLRAERLAEGDIRHLLYGIADAADRGEFQLLLHRFPSDLCLDQGRALNNQEEDWPDTLAGIPAQLHAFWQENLEAQGYGITAYVLEYPDGMPGDAGLFLTWR